MTQRPILVIHGAAVRDRAAFEADVARLADQVGISRPFVPVFWGDLAQPAEAIEEVLPYGQWLTSQDDDDAGLDVEALDEMIDEQPLSPAGERLMERMGAAWKRQSATARRRVLGRVYGAVRVRYLNMAAHFAGDIILYQRRQAAIHARVWETLVRDAPGWGVAEAPVSVITHSLGGSVAFDVAVDGQPRLHVDHLVSCACTAPYFHVIGCSPASLPSHAPGTPVTLPGSIGTWTNFFVPLDPWGYLAAPVFRLSDGSSPVDIEVHTGDRQDRVLRHGATHYWNHPLVISLLREQLGP